MPRSECAVRIVRQLLRLRAVNALPLEETAPGRGIWRFKFRAAAQPITIDLDATVLTLRCYHGRDEVAMSPISVETLNQLLGRAPVTADVGNAGEAQCIEELRKIVADWREGNPRLGMQPPETVGHPDNWNHG